MSQTSIRRHQESVTVEASAETLYDLVSEGSSMSGVEVTCRNPFG